MAAPTRSENTRRLLAQTAARIIEAGGMRSLTMISAALESGLARATVYNYVRDKEQLATLAYQEFFREIREVSTSSDPRRGLFELSTFISNHPLIVGLRAFNPALLHEGIAHVLSLPEDVAEAASEQLQRWDANSDRCASETVLRWLTSFCINPGDEAAREAGAEVVAASLRIDAAL